MSLLQVLYGDPEGMPLMKVIEAGARASRSRQRHGPPCWRTGSLCPCRPGPSGRRFRTSYHSQWLIYTFGGFAAAELLRPLPGRPGWPRTGAEQRPQRQHVKRCTDAAQGRQTCPTRPLKSLANPSDPAGCRRAEQGLTGRFWERVVDHAPWWAGKACHLNHATYVIRRSRPECHFDKPAPR